MATASRSHSCGKETDAALLPEESLTLVCLCCYSCLFSCCHQYYICDSKKTCHEMLSVKVCELASFTDSLLLITQISPTC